MKHNLFVSVHVPKTAGTSFKHYLEYVFGDNLVLDYRSKPLDSGYEIRALDNSETDTSAFRDIFEKLQSADVCVHGHFLPAKYLSIFPEAKLISWVRDPAQRLMSHYQFWRQNPQPNHSIARLVLEEDFSFSQFCELHLMQNINSRFFGGLDLERFDFIGVSEEYHQSLEKLSHLFKWPLDESVAHSERARENPLKTGPEYTFSDTDISRVRQLNQLDYDLYQSIVAMGK
jgi:hypothetical protein